MTASGWDTSGTAPGRLADAFTSVRLVGVTRHKVHGRGVHEHRSYVTADGQEIVVTHWPDTPSAATVATWTADGERRELRDTNASPDWVLAGAGFRVATMTTTPTSRGPWLGPRPPVKSSPETTSPARPPAHPEGPPA